MLRKFLLLLILPVVLAASPIAVFSVPGLWSKAVAAISSLTNGKAPETPPTSPATPAKSPPRTDSGSGPAAVPGPSVSSTSLADIPVADLVEVLRFDVTVDWIMGRWPRVSAGLAQLQLQGYRVPLVTGTAEDDLAGALTYYFNPRQELQRITFQGTTANPRKLVQLLAAQYGFARHLTNDPSSFVYEAPGPEKKPKSVLWIRPARVLKADETHQRYQLSLVLERGAEP